MQVQKIQVAEGNKSVVGINTRRSNPSFGYNALVNAQLIKILDNAKKNKDYHNYIKDITLSTLDVEKKLKSAEKKNKKNLQMLLIASFLPMKVLLTDMINALFPDLNYREKELEAYQEEIQKRNLAEEHPEHWLNDLASVLKDHEAQDRTDIKIGVFKKFAKEECPELQIDFISLRRALKEQYLSELEEEYEEVDDAEIQNNIDVNNSNNENLKERIELGKSKVFHYEPSTENEQLGFASLGGMKELKKQLMEDIIIPLRNPKEAKYNELHYGIKRPNGILFYGPPGCGKTTLVERLSVETGLPLLELTTDSFGSEYINGSEINLGAVFDYAASIATEEKPVILFIDDVDGIVGNRNAFMHDHKKSELAVFLKRVQEAPKNNIIVIAATNNYDGIDKAFTSRLRQQIYAGLPDFEARKSIIKMKLEETDNGQTLAQDEKALDKIAELTESFPIRALEDFATETRKMAFINGIRDITLEDYEKIISKPESQNKKIKEDLYKTNATKKSIGFNPS